MAAGSVSTAICSTRMRPSSSADISSLGSTLPLSRLRFVPIVNPSQLLTNSQAATFTTTKAIDAEIPTKYPILTFNASKDTNAMMLSVSLLTTRFSSYIILLGIRPNTAKVLCIKKLANTTNIALLLTLTNKSRSSCSMKCLKINISMISNIKQYGAPIPISKCFFIKTWSS